MVALAGAAEFFNHEVSAFIRSGLEGSYAPNGTWYPHAPNGATRNGRCAQSQRSNHAAISDFISGV